MTTLSTASHPTPQTLEKRLGLSRGEEEETQRELQAGSAESMVTRALNNEGLRWGRLSSQVASYREYERRGKRVGVLKRWLGADKTQGFRVGNERSLRRGSPHEVAPLWVQLLARNRSLSAF